MLADELYEYVFSASAARRYKETDCAAEGDPRASGLDVQWLSTILVISDGRARIDSVRLASDDHGGRLAGCLARKLGLVGRTYSVPGEVDATILVDWPVELSPRV